MTLDRLDGLIRKYLSTGAALVLVLVGQATAPTGGTAAPSASTTGTHSTARPASTTSARPTADPTDRATDATTDPGPTTHARHRATATAEPAPASRAGPSLGPTADPAEPTTTSAAGSAEPTAGTTASGPSPAAPTPTTARPAGVDGKTAAATYGWGKPNREDDFTEDLSGWGLYDGPGHAGKGTRAPAAATVADGVLTIRGDAEGTTEGMAWNHGEGQKYGRWEGRVRAPAGDPSYNALLLLWPDAEDFPEGGEIDFMEMTDHTRQSTNVFLHHGEDNAQEHGLVKIDATQWHDWAVEWTPKGVTTYVDGKAWWHTDNTAALPPGSMHLCIQLDWFPQEAAGDVTPSQMQVDWVRQYPLDTSSDKSAKSDVTQGTFG
jgi:Glycosyl hydrolases family 16